LQLRSLISLNNRKTTAHFAHFQSVYWTSVAEEGSIGFAHVALVRFSSVRVVTDAGHEIMFASVDHVGDHFGCFKLLGHSFSAQLLPQEVAHRLNVVQLHRLESLLGFIR